MPKLKTKSGVKKRFRILSSGLVKVPQSGKRHGMRKRSGRTIRESRGFFAIGDDHPKAALIKRHMPYA